MMQRIVGRRSNRKTALVAVCCATVLAAAAGADEPAKKSGPLHFRPKARILSTYTSEARFEVGVRDVTFEVPDSYRDSFNFWSGRMKGQKRSETCQMLTMTEEAGENGRVAFRRTVPKYDVELLQGGQVMTPPIGFEKTVATLVWEGTLDPLGNVTEIRKVMGKEDPDLEVLAIPEMSVVFPEVKAPRDLEIGASFIDERIARLPTKLNISGLDKLTLKTTREYKLKSFDDHMATFDVKVTYSNDPAFKPGMARTTCTISGGGTGEAVFEIKRGVFQQTRLPASMRVDIEAPLRPLPDQAASDLPPLGKSHIDLDFLLSSRQTVKRIWGEDQD